MKNKFIFIFAFGFVLAIIAGAYFWIFPQSEKAVMAGLVTELADDVALYTYHHDGKLPDSWDAFIAWHKINNPIRPDKWNAHDLHALGALRWSEQIPLLEDNTAQSTQPLIQIQIEKYRFLEMYFTKRLEEALQKLQSSHPSE